MKTLGIIGGVGPESTVDYYRLIISAYQQRKPDGSYPPMIINSVDLQQMVRLLEAGNLAGLAQRLVAEIQKLASAGAELALLASNTPHIVFDEIQRQSPLPLVSIVQATCDAARAQGLKKLGLFGSRFTMQGSFYQEVFSKAGIVLATPQPDEQTYIHEHYMDELVKGVFLPETRAGLLRIVDRMKDQEQIEGLILGGTELPLILRNVAGYSIPFLDTARIHVDAVIERLLS